MYDGTRKIFTFGGKPITRLNDVYWISTEQLARELRLLSESRFNKQPSDNGLKSCDRYPDCELPVAKREDQRSGKEL